MSSAAEEITNYYTDPRTHPSCTTNHPRSKCGDPRCAGRTRCFYDCRGCPCMPKNKIMADKETERVAAKKTEEDTFKEWDDAKENQKEFTKKIMKRKEWEGKKDEQHEKLVNLTELNKMVEDSWCKYMLARDKHSEIIKALN
jgi:hypothetical protein